MGTLALIGLGSNLGDRKAHLDFAVDALSGIEGDEVRGVSSYHETEPVGGPGGQGTFLNAAVALETSLEPLVLLHRLHQTEHSVGRNRSVRWGERTLDLDLILHGNQVIDTPELRLPHPRFWVRRFVLAPLAEIAPDAIDPATARTVRELLENLDRRPSCVALIGDGSQELCRRLMGELPSDGIVIDQGLDDDDCYEAKSDLLFAHETDWNALLDQKVREFDARRWSGERWVVTPFWFDLIDRDALQYVPDPIEWRKRFLQAREQVIRPTFLVASNAYTYWQLRLWLDLNRDTHPIGRDVPLFWPRASEPLSPLVGQDLDALTALISPSADEIDRMVPEILSACAATRIG